MKKSFTQIAAEVVEELYPADEENTPDINVESIVKRLLRQFTKFIEIMGGKVEELKNGQGRMFFEDDEARFLKIVLLQLEKKEGVVYDIMKRKEPAGSIEEVHDLIQMMLDAMSEDGITDEEAQALVNWLDRLFQFSFWVTIGNCHRLVDGVALNLLPQPYTHSMIHIQRFYSTLKKSFAETTVYAAMMLGELGEFIRNAMELAETDDPSDLYGKEEDAVKSEYRQRDTNVVEFLKANPEIRQYVEKRMGATVEEVWNIKDVSQGE